jgi:uncharacterized protein with HEPN domain
MVDMTRKVVEAVGGKHREEYDADEILRLGSAHLVQVIGEAARKVSAEFQQALPEIPWRKIIGMRHCIVHDYVRLDEDVLWEVVHSDLPALWPVLAQITPP